MARGENCIYIALDDSPESFIEQLESFGWPGREFYDKGLLYIIDGYGYVTGEALKSSYSKKKVDIQKIDEFIYTIVSSVEELKIRESGLVIVDSLNDLFYFHDISKIVMFIKSIRAYVSKSRGVISLQVLHTDTDELANLEKNIEHLFDGVIYTRINEDLRNIGIPLKELLVKKLRGAPTNPFWIPYAVTSSGIKLVDMEKLTSLVRSKIKEYERLRQVESKN